MGQQENPGKDRQQVMNRLLLFSLRKKSCCGGSFWRPSVTKTRQLAFGKISATAGAKIGNGFPFVLKQIRCGSPFWSLSKRSKLLQKVETKWVEIDTFQLKDADLALFGRPLGNGAFFTGDQPFGACVAEVTPPTLGGVRSANFI